MADQREPPPLDDYDENDDFADVSLDQQDPVKVEENNELFTIIKDDKKEPEKETASSVTGKEESHVEAKDAENDVEDVEVESVPTEDAAETKPITVDDEENVPIGAGAAQSIKVDEPVPVPRKSVPVDTNTPVVKPVVSPVVDDEEDLTTENETNDINITVGDPHKVGEGMNAYMSYKVHTKTSMSTFKRPELTVDRRFSDFLGLHEKLIAKHRHAGRVVPPAPEKSLVGMTLVKMSKTDEEATSIDFIERRRAALERYLNRIARHQLLVQDQDFRDFLEQEELPQATNTRALSGAGVMRLVKNVEGAFNKITIKMTEEDSWFEEKQQQIESLEQQIRKLHIAFESLVHNRKELAVNTSLFAKSAATLGNAEEHTALSRALAQLSDAFEKMESVYQDQSNTDYYGVTETLHDYLKIIGEIKEVFMVRVKSWQNWQNAVQSVNRKKETEAKLQASGKTDKISQVQAEINELEGRVETSKGDFDNLSAAIKKDMKKFEEDRIVDFRQLVLVFLKNLMKSQEQCMKNWEGFMPEARAIA